jgi:hypothetical protein
VFIENLRVFQSYNFLFKIKKAFKPNIKVGAKIIISKKQIRLDKFKFKKMKPLCVICTEVFVINSQITACNCGHIFHEECIFRLFLNYLQE